MERASQIIAIERVYSVDETGVMLSMPGSVEVRRKGWQVKLKRRVRETKRDCDRVHRC